MRHCFFLFFNHRIRPPILLIPCLCGRAGRYVTESPARGTKPFPTITSRAGSAAADRLSSYVSIYYLYYFGAMENRTRKQHTVRFAVNLSHAAFCQPSAFKDSEYRRPLPLIREPSAPAPSMMLFSSGISRSSATFSSTLPKHDATPLMFPALIAPARLSTSG